MRLQTYILCPLLGVAGALAQHPTTRLALPDSTAIMNYSGGEHEKILLCFRTMRIGSWNFAWDDSTVRHYGPTAQEFFSGFGTDSMGAIGNEANTAPADIDGVAMIAIQALEDRTRFLRAALAEKDEEINSLRLELSELKMVARKIRTTIGEFYLANVQLQNRLDQLEKASESAGAKMSSLR